MKLYLILLLGVLMSCTTKTNVPSPLPIKLIQKDTLDVLTVQRVDELMTDKGRKKKMFFKSRLTGVTYDVTVPILEPHKDRIYHIKYTYIDSLNNKTFKEKLE